MNMVLYHHLQKMEPPKSTSKHIKVTRNKPDYETMWSLCGWLPIDIIKKTFQLTTQYTRTPTSVIFKKHYTSLFPAMNVTQVDDPIATYIVYVYTPAVDDGFKHT